MRIRTIAIIVLALVFGASAVAAVGQLVAYVRNPLELETVPVVVAGRDVVRGELLTADVLRLLDCPKSMVPAGAITSVDDALDRTAIVPLLAGETLMEQKLAAKDAGRGLAWAIPQGMRAWTIPMPHAAAGGGGFILPGNRVDVLLTAPSDSRHDGSADHAEGPLLQNIEVLAVDQNLDAPSDNKMDPAQLRTVTLLVTLEQAMTLAKVRGQLHLVLRNPTDDARRLATTDPAEIDGGAAPLADDRDDDASDPSLSDTVFVGKREGVVLLLRGSSVGRYQPQGGRTGISTEQ